MKIRIIKVQYLFFAGVIIARWQHPIKPPWSFTSMGRNIPNEWFSFNLQIFKLKTDKIYLHRDIRMKSEHLKLKPFQIAQELSSETCTY